jgi:hypothetical protein
MRQDILLGTLLLSLWLPVQRSQAQEVSVNYTADTSDFPNPERGFYVPSGTAAGQFVSLEPGKLKNQFAGAHRYANARYAVYATLLMREYTLDVFREKPLSQDFLNAVDKDLASVREAGLKVILRFAYINKTKTGDCPDEYKICPPYGDAPKSIVLEHIAQLKPLLKKYTDVIAILQEGFIGIWGENYFTDYFGDASGNGPGRIPDESWKDRNEVLHALLDALPEDRMVQVRTPQIKQKYAYGPQAGVDSKPLSAKEALSHSELSRIGFHNDCFLSGPTDYGTYYDYGSSVSPKKEANEAMRKYLQEDSRYVAVGGETCDDAYSPQNDCAPAGHAEAEMAGVHLSFLNSAYNNDVNNDWDSLGCMNSIRKRLGYRFTLSEGLFPAKASAGHDFSFTIRLQNDGYASPYNPRPVFMIFRNRKNGTEFAVACSADARTWFSGATEWKETIHLPALMPAGNYDLLLDLPDKYPSIAKNPAYSIRLANNGCWENNTGFNNLNFTLVVTSSHERG